MSGVFISPFLSEGGQLPALTPSHSYFPAHAHAWPSVVVTVDVDPLASLHLPLAVRPVLRACTTVMAAMEENHSSGANPLRGMRRKFTDVTDTALLKEVVAHNAHVARRGDSGSVFDAVAISLNETDVLPWRTDGKHCSDRFHLLVRAFRQTDATRRGESGREEEYTEKEQLLQDIVSALDDFNEVRREQQAAASRRDEQLRNAGEAVRAEAMNRGGRATNVNESSNEDENQGTAREEPGSRSGNSTDSSRRPKRKRDGFSEEWMDGLLEIEERRLGQESDRIRLESDRLKLDRDKFVSSETREAERFSFQQEQFKSQGEMQLKMMSVLDRIIQKMQ
jgi:hypothetical protein